MPMPYYSAIEFAPFQPAMRCILSITNSFPVVITTTYDGVNPGEHGYHQHAIMRLYIPRGWGMQPLNHFKGVICVTSPTTFTMDIDTTLFDPLVMPTVQPTLWATPPQVVPVGRVSQLYKYSTNNVLPYPFMDFLT